MPFFFPAGASNFEKHILLQGLGKECPVMAMPQLSLYIKAVQQIPFASSAGSRGATLSLISPGACSFSAELVWGVIVGDFGKNQELFIRLYTFGKSPKPSKLGAGMSRKLRKVEIGLLGVFRDVPYSRNEWHEKSEDRRSDVLLSLVAKVVHKKQKTTRSIQKFLI